MMVQMISWKVLELSMQDNLLLEVMGLVQRITPRSASTVTNWGTTLTAVAC